MLKYVITFLFVISIILFSGQNELFAQQDKIVFEHYSINQGTYEINITSIIQDKTGFLWFGTWSGIEKYDGYNFITYVNNPDDTNSIDNAFVNTLYEDKEGNIWIGTWHGLEFFDKVSGIFKHFKPHPSNEETKLNNNIHAICEDENDILWIGTQDGLNKFDKRSGKFTVLLHETNNPESISSNIINAIHKDHEGSLWFGTGNGLDKLDQKSGKFIHYWNNSKNKIESSDYFINTIFEDKSGILWLGTLNGLIKFDPSKNSFSRYIKGNGNSISSICEDDYGTLWIGTLESGLFAIDKSTMNISHFIHDPEESSSISSNEIMSVYKEHSGTIWITTLGGGINKINRVKQPFKKYSFEGVTKIVKGINDKIWIGTIKGWYIFYPNEERLFPYSFGSDYLVKEDQSGELWIGKASGGLYKKDESGKITNFYTSPGQEITKRISCFYRETNGNIWIGTGGGGVYKIEPDNNRMNKILQTNGTIKNFYLDDFGIMWIASFEGGLVCYDPIKKIIVKKYFPDSHNPNSIKSYTFLEILPDKYGTLWFATNKGLCKYDKLNDSFIYYDKKDGLPHEVIFSILKDDKDNIWLSTWKGISKFNMKTNQVQSFDASYGLPEEGLANIYGCKTENGEMYFGYPSGIIRFHPDSIKVNSYIPPILITAIRKSDELINTQNDIKLSYNDNFLSFEFVALSYISPERNEYAYKMEGIDTGWVYSGSRRFASYPNLKPGKYIFKVKGSNNDGVWNEVGTSVTIIILPPWWKTWWAYLFYGCCFIFVLYAIRRYELNRISYKNQVMVDKAILHEKEETEKLKSRFFANISHEFRTPLTLILGPAEKINSNSSKDIVKDAGTIKRNAQRLLQLVNQLLDLSRLEAGALKLEASEGNIVSFVKGITLSFESLFESKDITLKLQAERDHIELYFDRDKMIKILTNILSNAFKFTPEDGKITISIKEYHPELDSVSFFNKKIPGQARNDNTRGFVEIKIRDNGIGIPQEDIPKLFDRFYQVDSSLTKEYEGTGIGLALTKELVELHHGNISVDSKIGEWTEFTLKFPEGRVHLKDEEIIEEKETEPNVIPSEGRNLKPEIINNNNKEDVSSPEFQNNFEGNEEKTIILVVEDNYDMREFIKESLGKGYQIEEAVNGEQGVKKAEKIIPDIIISDMMMPKMDGGELTRTLKNNEITSHIPIILLTARSGQENKIDGLETGADEYLTKPFDTKELQIRIKNLITIRKKIHEKFSKLATLPLVTENKKISSYDEKFMYKVMEVIEKHISEEDFSTEEFGKELGMSRMQVHRKLKALTGKSAIQFIRKVKLDKARKMIKGKNGNISEIAFSLGFGSPAYFTKCFKEEFGYPPSEIQE